MKGEAMATKPNEQYQSAYSSMIDDLVNKAINREEFQYNPASDPAYQAYARQYMRMGDEASRNTLADVSAQTGGLPSSYAVTASQQARNTYNQALTEKLPSLMETAYNKYRTKYTDTLNDLNTYQNLENTAYNRYLADRDYNRSVEEAERDYNRRVYESDREYNDKLNQQKVAQEYERMLNLWETLGYATDEVAKYFGVAKGTKTNDVVYREAQLALDRARLAL